MLNSNFSSGEKRSQTWVFEYTEKKQSSPAVSICVWRHNKSLSALIWSRERWLIARFSNFLTSVFRLKGLTFQNINVVVLSFVVQYVGSRAIKVLLGSKAPVERISFSTVSPCSYSSRPALEPVTVSPISPGPGEHAPFCGHCMNAWGISAAMILSWQFLRSEDGP